MFDDEGLAETLRQLIPQCTGDDVEISPGRKRNDECNGSRRVVLGVRDGGRLCRQHNRDHEQHQSLRSHDLLSLAVRNDLRCLLAVARCTHGLLAIGPWWAAWLEC